MNNDVNNSNNDNNDDNNNNFIKYTSNKKRIRLMVFKKVCF